MTLFSVVYVNPGGKGNSAMSPVWKVHLESIARRCVTAKMVDIVIMLSDAYVLLVGSVVGATVGALSDHMGQTALRNVIVERMVNVTQSLDVFVSLDGWAGIARTSVQRASLGISVRRDAPVITTPHAIMFLDASVQMVGQEHSATSPARKVYLAKIALGSVDAIMGHATLW